MKFPSNQCDVSNQYSYLVPFGAFDKKGREIGAVISKDTRIFSRVEKPADKDYLVYDKEPGVYFCFRAHASRDGATYGATQALKYFTTQAEREAAIERYLEAAIKRASKR